MIVVTGATGNVGSAVVRALAGAGEQVRAVVRREPADLPPGVTAVTGDLNKPETLTDALSGARGLFLLPGYENMPQLLADARRAGVAHVVLLSSSSVEGGEYSNAVTRYMMDSEAAVQDSGLAWTIVRPNAFMSNALQWVPQLRDGDVVRAPFAGARAAVIDPYDIGAVAAAALTTPGHEGRRYAVTGPESLLPADRLDILAAVLGRALRFEAQPDDEAREEMSRSMPAEYVDAFFRFYVDGTLDESPVRPTVREVLGREPRTFRQWAEAHADAFR
jgi:uncharacterized protein YbjT (DUF2867 family)